MSRIIVADAGPLHYLILIDCAGVLEKLFDQILIPRAVHDELLRESTPEKVRSWILAPKHWLEVRTVLDPRPIQGLHPGETEALQLALETASPSILMDDLDGCKAARLLGLTVVGTIGLLERAAEKGLLGLPETFARLRETNFFVSPDLLDAALERDRLAKLRDR